jgi:pimeloyl-ACP methyl ester carboxylesterase
MFGGASKFGSLDCLSISHFTADLADLIFAEVLEAPVVGGISMGAAIALRLAVTRPELVRGLVLARPAWLTASAPPNMRPNALVGDLLSRLGPDEGLAEFEKSAVIADLSETGPDNLSSLRGFFRRVPLDQTAALLTRISADGPGVDVDDLRKLQMPVLVIGHQRDHVHPMGLARELAEAIPNAHFLEITPKATDQARYYADFRSALAQFLKGL